MHSNLKLCGLVSPETPCLMVCFTRPHNRPGADLPCDFASFTVLKADLPAVTARWERNGFSLSPNSARHEYRYGDLYPTWAERNEPPHEIAYTLPF